MRNDPSHPAQRVRPNNTAGAQAVPVPAAGLADAVRADQGRGQLQGHAGAGGVLQVGGVPGRAHRGGHHAH